MKKFLNRVRVNTLYCLFFIVLLLKVQIVFAGGPTKDGVAARERSVSRGRAALTCPFSERFTWSEESWVECAKTEIPPEKLKNIRYRSNGKYVQDIDELNIIEIEYYDTTDSSTAVLRYDQLKSELTFLSSFRGEKPSIPTCMIQFLTLKNLATKLKKPINIAKMTRSNVINKGAIHALMVDYPTFQPPSINALRTNSFETSCFLKSENGRNTLSVIKTINPRENPFTLIRSIHVENNEPLSEIPITLEVDILDGVDSVSIILKKPIVILPQ